MKIETKFSIGDRVCHIYNSKPKSWVVCPVCKGERKVILGNKSFDCPECYGHGGKTVWGEENLWMVEERKITIAVVRPNYSKRQKDNEIVYMTEEYGYPSGSLLKEEDLYPTEEDALKECERRNKSS